MPDTLGEVYLKSVIKRLRNYKELADHTFIQLADADFHHEPAEGSNSIAVIIRHMSGNMLSRWTNFLTEDGEKEWRDRDGEFRNREMTRDELIACWERGWACVIGSLRSLTDDDLTKTIHIRTEPLTAIDAINRQLAHYPHHIGQIVYIGKLIRKSAWKSLSIPKGQSVNFNKDMSSIKYKV